MLEYAHAERAYDRFADTGKKVLEFFCKASQSRIEITAHVRQDKGRHIDVDFEIQMLPVGNLRAKTILDFPMGNARNEIFQLCRRVRNAESVRRAGVEQIDIIRRQRAVAVRQGHRNIDERSDLPVLILRK